MKKLLLIFSCLLLLGCADPLRNKDIEMSVDRTAFKCTYMHAKGSKNYYLIIHMYYNDVKKVYIDMEGDGLADYCMELHPRPGGKYEKVREVSREDYPDGWQMVDRVFSDFRLHAERVYGSR